MKSIALLVFLALSACGGGSSDTPKPSAVNDTAVHGHTALTACFPKGVQSVCPVFIKDVP